MKKRVLPLWDVYAVRTDDVPEFNTAVETLRASSRDEALKAYFRRHPSREAKFPDGSFERVKNTVNPGGHTVETIELYHDADPNDPLSDGDYDGDCIIRCLYVVPHGAPMEVSVPYSERAGVYVSFQEPRLSGTLAVYYHGVDSDKKLEKVIKECTTLIRSSDNIKTCISRLLKAGVKFDAYGMSHDSAMTSVKEIFGAEFAEKEHLWTESWIPDGMALIALPQVYFIDRNAEDLEHAKEYGILVPGRAMQKRTEGIIRYNRWTVWLGGDYYYLNGKLHKDKKYVLKSQ